MTSKFQVIGDYPSRYVGRNSVFMEARKVVLATFATREEAEKLARRSKTYRFVQEVAN